MDSRWTDNHSDFKWHSQASFLRPVSAPPQLEHSNTPPIETLRQSQYHASFLPFRPVDSRLPPPLYETPLPIQPTAPTPVHPFSSLLRAHDNDHQDSDLPSYSHFRSPLEMIQSDFPRTSSPMFNPSISPAPRLSNSLSFSSERRYSLDATADNSIRRIPSLQNQDYAFQRMTSQLESMSMYDSAPIRLRQSDSPAPADYHASSGIAPLGLRSISPIITGLPAAPQTSIAPKYSDSITYPSAIRPRSRDILEDLETKTYWEHKDEDPSWDEHPAPPAASLAANSTSNSRRNGHARSSTVDATSKTAKPKKRGSSTTSSANTETNSPRSELLQDLRSNKGGSSASSNVKIEDVIQQGLVIEFATDQNGSRFIQQSLEASNADQKQALFDQLEPICLRLCVDVFGNYVIQKFFEFGLPSHRRILADKLVGNVLPLALQMYGCRVIQKALEVISEDQQILLVQELEGHVVKCVKDQNGNHVVQKCIEKVPPQHIDFIVKAFKGQVFSLSTHAYGCRVVQRLLEYCTDGQKTAILEEIFSRVSDLVSDQYGNYVIQHVLQKGAISFRSSIVRQVRGHVMEMSKHKFASNVIEKCFAYATSDEKSMLVDEMVGDESFCPLAEMVKDQYANYVVQKVLGAVLDHDREKLIETIRTRVPGIRKIAYGRHICSRIEKLTGRVL